MEWWWTRPPSRWTRPPPRRSGLAALAAFRSSTAVPASRRRRSGGAPSAPRTPEESPMKSVEIDRSKRLSDQPRTGPNRWHPDVPPILEADEGEQVLLETRDGVDGQLGPSAPAAALAPMAPAPAPPLTHPLPL